MENIILDYLPIIFFFVSFIYSSVGMGGGSSYTAIMVMTSMTTAIIPMVSLVLNLFVTTLASIHFIKEKHTKISILIPFIVSAIPAAYLGGYLNLDKEAFLWILLISLIVVAIRIYLVKVTALNLHLTLKSKVIISLIAGTILGLVAGIVGIGGGIYLVPIIIMFNIGNAKQAAATAAIFVWLVSMSGLISRLQYNSIDITQYYTLIISVLIGGFLGSKMGSSKFSHNTMEKMLGIIILVAIVFLIKKLVLY